MAPSIDPNRFPWGWFVVAESHELVRERLLTMRYFATDLVAFRDDAGVARVVVDQCPTCCLPYSMGQSLVEGSAAVRCVRDGSTYRGDGTRVSSGRRDADSLGSLRTHESHGLVFVHYHPDGLDPSFTIPSIDVWGDPRWLSWEIRSLVIKTHPREVVENVVDYGHFVPVHQTDPKRFENEFDGVRAIQRAQGIGSDENKYAGDSYRLVATYHGPAYQITEFESRGVEARLLNAHTPIEKNLLHLRFGVMLPLMGDVARSERFRKAYVDDLNKGFAQDVAIWEHKVWRDNPILCDGDGPIPALRRWYSQFYQ